MRALLTNDDGILAPGLEVLEHVARTLCDEVWIVAPETDQSGIGHALTLSHPLRLREVGERRFAVDGTPADCVVVAVSEAMPEPPDIVLSGINAGQNVADDVLYSGTIGGAMEATFMGVRAIAVSQAYAPGNRDDLPWETSERHLPELLGALLDLDLPDGTFLNVNMPAVAPDAYRGAETATQGRVDHTLGTERRLDGRGKPYHWLRFSRGEPAMRPGSDIATLRDGRAAVTPLAIDLTARDSMDAVSERLKGLM